MLDKLAKAVSTKVDFMSIRAAVSHSTRVQLREKEVEEASYGSFTGFSVQALHNGAWGFACTSDERKLRQTIERAATLAKVASRKPIEASLARASTVKDSITTKPKKHPLDFGLDEKVSLCKELLPSKPKSIATHDLKYTDAWGSWYYVNSEGAEIECDCVRSFVSFSAFSKKNGEVLSAHDSHGGTVGLEILDRREKMIKDTLNLAIKLKRAELPPKGKMPVLIDPKMAGVFAHEMVGHACEGDEVANGKSILAGKLGRLLGSSEVNIVDDPTIPGLFGSYSYDAEGVKAERTQLFENGRLVNFLNSRESAARLGLKSTGNSRAESVSHFPIVRMSNTFFERGSASVDELFEGMNGVYAHGMKGGVTEPNTGFFQFAAEYGYLIEKGEKTKLLRDVTLVGNILNTLKHVEACGNDFEIGHPGFCGKAGQSVPVSDGGPHVKIKEMLVG